MTARRRLALAAGSALSLLLPSLPAAAQTALPVLNPVVVERWRDADTLVTTHGLALRLSGADALERRQTCTDAAGATYRCGEAALRAMVAIVGGRPLACLVNGAHGDRQTAVCLLPGGLDPMAGLVRQGWAVDAPEYAPDYGPLEREAAAQGRGAHAGEFVPPAAWRRGER